MPGRRTQVRLSLLALGAASAILAASPGLAADARASDAARARYLQERAVCESGQSHQDRATCLREAGAALEQARRGQLADNQSQYFEQNALARCAVLPSDDRKACEARMHGQGTARGSVAEGGIYRELIIRE